MKPMLARTLGPNFSAFPCYVQPKLNGVRALYQRGTFQSRGEKIWKPSFFPHIVAQLSHLNLGDNILDGEFYVHDWRLGRINSAVGVNNNEPNADTPNIVFNVFDTVDPNATFLERYRRIHAHRANYAHETPNVVIVPTALCNSRVELDAYFLQFVAAGYEGLMARPPGGYEFGEHLSPRTGTLTQFRSDTLWKHKQWEDGEFICTGFTPGEGKASIGIGALILDNGFGTEFRVGTGFDDSERIHYATHPPIGHLIRVRYLELTADGIPFNPSFIAVMN